MFLVVVPKTRPAVWDVNDAAILERETKIIILLTE